jgi:hypothetical protein
VVKELPSCALLSSALTVTVWVVSQSEGAMVSNGGSITKVVPTSGTTAT